MSGSVWNYDLTEAPKHEDVLLLWPSRLIEGEDDLPTGAIVGFRRVVGERVADDVTCNNSWSAPEIDDIPNAEFWGDNHEYAFAPHAWCHLPAVPEIPARGE